MTRTATAGEREVANLHATYSSYAYAAEYARDLIQSIDATGRILYANRAWLETLGYNAEELGGLSIFDIVRPSHRAHCKSVIERVLRGEDVGVVEVVFLTRDRTEIPLEGTVNRVNAPGKPVVTIGVFRDIRATHDAEEALHRSEEKYLKEREFNAAVLDATASLMVVLDWDGKILRFNRACEKLSGRSRDEVDGQHFWDVIGVSDPEEAARLRVAFESRDASLLPSAYEHYWVAKDGSRRLISWSLSRLDGGDTGYIIASGTDITQSREWEKALAESEEQYRSLFEQSIDAVLLTAPDGAILAANPEACRVFGQNEEEICRLGRNGLVDTSDPRLARLLEERQREGRARGELTLRRADGTTFQGEVSSAIFLDRDGRQNTSMIVRDITERKNAEDALRLSEERFRSAFENAAIGMALVAPGGRWLRVNGALCQIVGYSEDELLRSDFQTITHPDDLEADLGYAGQLLDGKIEVFQLEKRYIHKQGFVVWVLISVSLVRHADGRPLYFIAEIQDITARKRAEDAQRLLVEAGAALSSSIDYSTTLGNVAKLMVRSLADYCIIDVFEEDGQIRRIAGAHIDPARQHLVDELLAYSPSPSRRNAVAQVIGTRQPMLLLDISRDIVEASAADARHAQVMRELDATSCIIVPLEGQEGVVGAMSLLISEPGRKYSGGDLSLATDVARRAAMALENARLYDQAREALASRDALLSIVSHDIRNCLIAIGAFATVLPDFVPNDDTAESRQLLEGLAQIRGGVEQAKHLVHDLTDFALLQAGRSLQLARKPVDLVALARQVIPQQQQTTARHALTLSTNEPELVGSWDEERLARVLVNLLSNAIKYSPRGGEVLVSVERERGAREWAVLSVRDKGVGIPEEDLPYIFDRFSRARNALHIKGSGLGLFSARQIVQLLGGSISAESKEGVGSIFTVRLPLSEE